MKTIYELNKKLDVIRVESRKGLHQYGTYGMKACKETIKWNKENLNKDYPSQYVELVQRGLTEPFFNINMIVACEELMLEESK